MSRAHKRAVDAPQLDAEEIHVESLRLARVHGKQIADWYTRRQPADLFESGIMKRLDHYLIFHTEAPHRLQHALGQLRLVIAVILQFNVEADAAARFGQYLLQRRHAVGLLR